MYDVCDDKHYQQKSSIINFCIFFVMKINIKKDTGGFNCKLRNLCGNVIHVSLI